jgi:hypothetical protein
MSLVGQTEKIQREQISSGLHPESGHCSIRSACLKGATVRRLRCAPRHLHGAGPSR